MDCGVCGMGSSVEFLNLSANEISILLFQTI